MIRLLATLYKDERTREREELKKDGVSSILEKMYLGTLVKREQVSEFAHRLSSHQLATLSDGSTVLDKAIMEHNLLAASRLYLNISFDELGLVLGVDSLKAERMTREMISQGRLTVRCCSFIHLFDTHISCRVKLTRLKSWSTLETRMESCVVIGINLLLDCVDKLRIL